MTIHRNESHPSLQNRLLEAARLALENAYAPYSRFRVGAALVTPSEKVFTGCNVENGSYGLTICAERNAVFQMAASGEHKIRALLVAADTDESIPPCGACLQVMAEFADTKTTVWLAGRSGSIREFRFFDLLPQAFTLKKP